MEESKSREDDGVSNSSPALENNENDPLISLTIKTLDSQNHKIDKVDENSSIKNFKEKIANTEHVCIPKFPFKILMFPLVIEFDKIGVTTRDKVRIF